MRHAPRVSMIALLATALSGLVLLGLVGASGGRSGRAALVLPAADEAASPAVLITGSFDFQAVDEDGDPITTLDECSETAVTPEPAGAATPVPNYEREFLLLGRRAGDQQPLRLYSAVLPPDNAIPMSCHPGYVLLYVERGRVVLTAGEDTGGGMLGLINASAAVSRPLVPTPSGASGFCYLNCEVLPGQSVELGPGDGVFAQSARFSLHNPDPELAAGLLVASIEGDELPCSGHIC